MMENFELKSDLLDILGFCKGIATGGYVTSLSISHGANVKRSRVDEILPQLVEQNRLVKVEKGYTSNFNTFVACGALEGDKKLTKWRQENR